MNLFDTLLPYLFAIAIIAPCIILYVEKQYMRHKKMSKNKPSPLRTIGIIRQWILDINDERIPEDISALWFCLYQESFDCKSSQSKLSVSGYKLYMTGVKVYTPDDDDWASDVDFFPANGYSPWLNMPIEDDWERQLNEVADMLRSIIAEYPDIPLWRNRVVAYGFDDGDLIRLK